MNLMLALFPLFSLPANAGQIEEVKYLRDSDKVAVLMQEYCNKYEYEVKYSRICAKSFPPQLSMQIHSKIVEEGDCPTMHRRYLYLDADKMECGSGRTIVHLHEDDGSVTSVLLERDNPLE